MKLTAYLPTTKFIVGVAISLALLTLIITMVRNSAYGRKVRDWLGLMPNQSVVSMTA